MQAKCIKQNFAKMLDKCTAPVLGLKVVLTTMVVGHSRPNTIEFLLNYINQLDLIFTDSAGFIKFIAPNYFKTWMKNL